MSGDVNVYARNDWGNILARSYVKAVGMFWRNLQGKQVHMHIRSDGIVLRETCRIHIFIYLIKLNILFLIAKNSKL